MTLFLMLVGLIALVFINVPIAVSLAVVATLAILITQGAYMLPNVALTMYEGAQSFPLIAIPMFILAGAIMNSSGISRRLIAFASAIVGFVRGGLAMVNVTTSMFFAEISGSAVADVAAMGPIIIPAMEKKGYPRAFSAAITSSSASLAIIIPPSIPMILYGVMSGSSIVQLFVAGIVPGVIGGVSLMAACYWMAVRNGWPVEEIFQIRRVWATFKDAAWAFLIPFIILGSIFGGFVTATEGAGIAVLASLFIGGVIYRELDWKFLYQACIEGAVQTAVVMLLVAASALLGIYLTEARVPQQIAQAILDFTQNKYAVLAILNVFFLIIGLFLHSAAADRHAAGSGGGHRSGAFRPDRHAEPGDRPADPAGGERSDRRMLRRQGRHMGSHENQCMVRRCVARGPHADHLCAGGTDEPCLLLLPLTATHIDH